MKTVYRERAESIAEHAYVTKGGRLTLVDVVEALCFQVHNETVEKCADRMATANMPGMADYLRELKLPEPS